MRDEENTSDDLSIYSEESREELVEAGGMTPEEDAFMKGYEDQEEQEEDEIC